MSGLIEDRWTADFMERLWPFPRSWERLVVVRAPRSFDLIPYRFVLPPDWDPAGHFVGTGTWPLEPRLRYFFRPARVGGVVVALAPAVVAG